MYLEECIKKTYMSSHDSPIFTISVANKLPKFINGSNDIIDSPYLSLLIDKKILDIDNNIMGV